MEPNPISYHEIDAWTRLMNVYILPDEIDMLIMMDSEYLSALAVEREAMREDAKS
ncbi:MAG: hypothetical protein GVY36_19230 [Verrucomicrobia bacterium]|jgi:hypothetical protein|nr:hypothetical protein [Verrucomicrobiota bacterium]